MTWILYSTSLTLWLALLILTLLRILRGRGDDGVRKAANILPPLVIVSLIAAFALIPCGKGIPSLPTRVIHYFGITLLFAFLIFGAYSQVNIAIKIRQGAAWAGVVAAYRRWSIATRLLPAPAALAILLSGFRLTYESTGMDVSLVPWLAVLVAGFSFFFFDGLLFYAPEVSRLYACSMRGSRAAGLRDRSSEAALMFHFISFPFVLCLAITRPDIPAWLVAWSHWLSCLYTGLPMRVEQLLRAITLVAAIGIFILILRLPGLIRRRRACLTK